jgi:hypothetical protein
MEHEDEACHSSTMKKVAMDGSTLGLGHHATHVSSECSRAGANGGQDAETLMQQY